MSSGGNTGGNKSPTGQLNLSVDLNRPKSGGPNRSAISASRAKSGNAATKKKTKSKTQSQSRTEEDSRYPQQKEGSSLVGNSGINSEQDSRLFGNSSTVTENNGYGRSDVKKASTGSSHNWIKKGIGMTQGESRSMQSKTLNMEESKASAASSMFENDSMLGGSAMGSEQRSISPVPNPHDTLTQKTKRTIQQIHRMQNMQ